MTKNVLSKVKLCFPTALVILGWLAFIAGVSVVQPLGLKLALLSAARVLP